MPWKECTKLDQRMEFVMRVTYGQQSFSSLCGEFGISRKTGYKWLHRYQETGSLFALADRSRRPHTSPNKTAPEKEALVVQLRKAEGWGARKIQPLLAQRDVHLTEITINRIIKRKGLLRKEGSNRPAVKRFEHEAPNDLWQIDLKGHINLNDGTKCYPFSVLDDHSRYLLGLFPLQKARTKPIWRSLCQVFDCHGLPKAILTDHGPPFWSTSNVLGLTQLSVAILNQDIRLIRSGVFHPQTQGKVERLHRTLQESMRHHGFPRTMEACQVFFARFREVYNYQRPHEALGMDVPADHYESSQRPYQIHPPEWEYPPEMQIRQLNPQGCLDYAGQRLFVCEALAREYVGLIEFAGKLYVHFRNYKIREIDLLSRRTKAPAAG